MLTREEMKKKLQENPDWELPESASDEEWDLYYEVRQELNLDEDTDGSWDDEWEEDADVL